MLSWIWYLIPANSFSLVWDLLSFLISLFILIMFFLNPNIFLPLEYQRIFYKHENLHILYFFVPQISNFIWVNLKKNTIHSLFRIHIPFKFDTIKITINTLICTKLFHDYKIKIHQKYNLMSYQHRVYCEKQIRK